MSAVYAIFISIGACVLTAALEGVCAGRNVKAFYAGLRSPRYATPLRVWDIIGALYYWIFWFVLYRLFRLDSDFAFRGVAPTLILSMMVVNAPDRARQSRLSWVEVEDYFGVF